MFTISVFYNLIRRHFTRSADAVLTYISYRKYDKKSSRLPKWRLNSTYSTNYLSTYILGLSKINVKKTTTLSIHIPSVMCKTPILLLSRTCKTHFHGFLKTACICLWWKIGRFWFWMMVSYLGLGLVDGRGTQRRAQ